MNPRPPLRQRGARFAKPGFSRSAGRLLVLCYDVRAVEEPATVRLPYPTDLLIAASGRLHECTSDWGPGFDATHRRYDFGGCVTSAVPAGT